jgi:hypothetical protein
VTRYAAAAALVGFLACWTATTPPGSSPDERAHHIRAVAAGRGEFAGRHSRVAPLRSRRFALSARSTRVFRVPAHVVAATYACNRKHAKKPASCVHAVRATGTVNRSTYVGTYPPFLYVPAGVVGRLSTSPLASLLWERLVFALLCAALLVAGVFVAGRGDHAIALLTLCAAVTPMTLFLAGSLNTSGVLIVASVVLGATLLVATRAADVHRSVWPLAATAGAITILARPEGVLWVALSVAVYWLMSPSIRTARPPAAFVAVMVAAAAPVVAWQLSIGDATRFGVAQLGLGARDVARNGRSLLQQAVGNFGWLDTPLPRLAYVLWWLVVAVAVAAAFAVATRRQRLALVIGPVVAVVATIVFQTVVVGPWRYTHQLAQARYTMPALLLGVLVAGELLDRRFARPRRSVLVAGAVFVALVDFGALVVHTRRNAVGVSGPWWFVAHAAWSPPLGWWPWVAVAMAAAGAAVLAFATPRYE